MHDRYYIEPSEPEISWLESCVEEVMAQHENLLQNIAEDLMTYNRYVIKENPDGSIERMDPLTDIDPIVFDSKDSDDLGMKIATMPHDKDGYVIIDGAIYGKIAAEYILEEGKELAKKLTTDLFANNQTLQKGDSVYNLNSDTNYKVTKVSPSGAAYLHPSKSRDKPVHHNGKCNKPNRAFQKKQKKQRKNNRRRK